MSRGLPKRERSGPRARGYAVTGARGFLQACIHVQCGEPKWALDARRGLAQYREMGSLYFFLYLCFAADATSSLAVVDEGLATGGGA